MLAVCILPLRIGNDAPIGTLPALHAIGAYGILPISGYAPTPFWAIPSRAGALSLALLA
jgi:hypothetical protein